MNIILSSLKTLPNLVYGKVVVFDTPLGYSSYRPTKYTTINDGFNPMDYSILIHDKYPKCIVYSTTKEKINFQITNQIKELYYCTSYRVGDKIHIKSRRGIYELVKIENECLIITCNKWRYDTNPFQHIPKSDFMCIAGGIHNAVHI